MQQGTEEWLRARVGKVTASRIADVVAKTKTGWGASRKNYAAELVIERLTGEPAPHYTNAAMEYGTQCEPEARAAYAFLQDINVEEVGFCPHYSIAEAGCSPDGLIGDDGLVEIKCPNSATHIEVLLSETIPDAHIKQMQFQMACTGRQWCDYLSYDKRLPEPMRIWIKRVTRDTKMITELEIAACVFLTEIEETIAALKSKYMVKRAA
jgi:putative phage-type endonuclease